MSIYRSHVLVCSGSNCTLKASGHLRSVLNNELVRAGLENEVKVLETGCFGLCSQGPLMVIYPEGVHYCRVTAADIPQIVSEHLLKGRVVNRLLYSGEVGSQQKSLEESAFYRKQNRVVLRNAGLIDPESIEEYMVRDGYNAVGKILSEMSPAQVVDAIKDSKLQGRGGAGFPTGLKWGFTAQASGDLKYVVCNADEGEPGTSKDRLILEGDPHSILEGMIVAAYAVGASRGYVYIRGEYKLSIERLSKAIDQAREYGLLGDSILGSDFSFDVEICSGAGAYVCGEETALLESIEGNRGEPRFKPPYPAYDGLWGKPTVINNVETLANIAPIINRGAEWFRSLGTAACPGTKVFTLSGNIVNSGLIEVPMGMTLREIIYDIGGGIPNGRRFKMAQTGGTSGGCISSSHLDVPMDIPNLQEVGTALGSGALLVVDDTHCVVDLAKNFVKFFAHESCGKCTPCREGTMALYRLISKVVEGTAVEQDIDTMLRLCRTMQQASLCGLGQTAPVPVLSMLNFFADEYREHLNARCPAGVCH